MAVKSKQNRISEDVPVFVHEVNVFCDEMI
jgi:hypothetical protein